MTKEELRVHCEKQIKMCEEWAKGNDREPSGKIYEEHKLILDLINELQDKSYELWKESYEEEHLRNIRLEEEIKALEQQTSDYCVDINHVIATISQHHFDKDKDNFDLLIHNLCKEVKALPPVTPTHCIATVRFSKDDLREICNERIEVECTHGTCKDCANYVMGALDEEICLRGHELIHKDFYCADFEKRGSENDI